LSEIGTNKNVIKAHPTKEFFISMLTRDITTDRAILDLIDNSIDAAYKNEKMDTKIEINIDEENFIIKDNAGGLDLEIAKEYAFCFGRSSSTPETPNSIGQFGVGMKRTLFKIGTEFDVMSKHNNIAYKVPVNVSEWVTDPKDWDFTFELLTNSELNNGETKIIVSTLRPEVKDLFAEVTFINNLQREISTAYFKHLHNGIKIFFNDQEIKSQDIMIKTSGELGAVKEVYSMDGVTITIICGVTDRDKESGGWNVVCNGRLVAESEQTELTGWGVNGIPKYHANYAFFRGLVEFTSADSSKLPWTTTKTGVDRDSQVYKSALHHMSECMQPIITFLKDRAEETNLFTTEQIKSQPLLSAISSASSKRIYDIEESKTFTRPAKEIAPAENATNVVVKYNVPAEHAELVRESLGVTTNSKAGKLTFEYYFKYECENE
jgi:hypothetical protein